MITKQIRLFQIVVNAIEITKLGNVMKTEKKKAAVGSSVRLLYLG